MLPSLTSVCDRNEPDALTGNCADGTMVCDVDGVCDDFDRAIAAAWTFAAASRRHLRLWRRSLSDYPSLRNHRSGEIESPSFIVAFIWRPYISGLFLLFTCYLYVCVRYSLLKRMQFCVRFAN